MAIRLNRDYNLLILQQPCLPKPKLLLPF